MKTAQPTLWRSRTPWSRRVPYGNDAQPLFHSLQHNALHDAVHLTADGGSDVHGIVPAIGVFAFEDDAAGSARDDSAERFVERPVYLLLPLRLRCDEASVLLLIDRLYLSIERYLLPLIF